MDHFIAEHQNLLYWGALAIFVIFIGWGVSKTFKGEAVFFYNYWDLFANLSTLVAFLCGYFNHEEKWAIYLMVLSPIIAIVYNYFMGIKFNGLFLGLSVGTGRIVLGYIVPLLMLSFAIFGNPDRRTGETKSEYELRRGIEKVERLALIGGLMFFLHKLVGHNVRKPKVDAYVEEEETESISPIVHLAIPAAETQDMHFDHSNDPVLLALRVPEVLPCAFDVTVQFWLARIGLWGTLKVIYINPAGQRRSVTAEEFGSAMTQEGGMIQRYGKWELKKKTIKSFEAFREFVGDDGKKKTEKYIVDIELKKDLKDAFNGKF